MEQLSSFFKKKININYGGELIDLSEPTVMGIVNITPDSFYVNSRYQHEEAIINRVKQVIEEGGKIVDLGAYSSRPGAEDISFDEEYKRLSFALSVVKKHYPHAVISVDTFRAGIVERIYGEYGTFIVNDISAGGLDGNMYTEVGRLKLPYIAMHMKGNPQTMVRETCYNNLMQDIFAYFADKIQRLLDAGVLDILIDPGFGFSKNQTQNYEILQRLDEFKIFELPVLVGVSRKKMIYNVLGGSPQDALNGTTVINTIALLKGADILRVHDVKEAIECVKIVKELNIIN